jgi:hypothetical protein
MTVKELIEYLKSAPSQSTVRLVLERPQVEGELFHEAKVVWWDDQRETTFIGDSL